MIEGKAGRVVSAIKLKGRLGGDWGFGGSILSKEFKVKETHDGIEY